MTIHVPVLATEILERFELQPGETVVDGTLGGGGHARLFSERVGPSGRVIGLDRDPRAVSRATASLPPNVTAVHANYAELGNVLSDLGIPWVDAILLDLGLSSDQLADETRGFSFRTGGDLDLRFDPTQGQPAWELLAQIREEDLANLIFRYGEERKSRRIARHIVHFRRGGKLRTAEQLAELIRECVPRSQNHPIDPATRTFQALRIAVNDELHWLETALSEFPKYLRPGGKFAVISFHSLEDRRVKYAFRDNPIWQVITKKPVIASEQELQENPRSRSAKLRVACKSIPADSSCSAIPLAPPRR